MAARSTPASTVTAARLAELLGVQPSSVLRWAREGRIPSHRVGSRVWFVLDEVNTATLRPMVKAERIAEPVDVARPGTDLKSAIEEAERIIAGGQRRRSGRAAAKNKTGRVSGSGRPQ